MPEVYFPGFNFETFEPVRLVIQEVEHPLKLTTSGEIIRLDDLARDLDDPGGITHIPWNPNQVKKEFIEQLRRINQQIGHSGLTMRGRTIKFITPEDMQPQTDLEKLRMVERYHSIIESFGSCRRNTNGTFILRIGFANQEETTPVDTVLGAIAHEYGHTLGESIDSAVFEEVKAYAFEGLFIRHFKNVPGYHLNPMLDEGVHDKALFYLEQLMLQGISEEAVIAHLTRRSFGRFQPEDYLGFLNTQL